jgi:hypothetical protein
MLGFNSKQAAKTMTCKASVLDPLGIILEKAKNKNQYDIDLVIDAGTSNIAAMLGCDGSLSAYSISSDAFNSMDRTATSVWKLVLNKFDTFCKSTRKDCMFIADGLRPFCLSNDSKLEEVNCQKSSIEDKILPKLKLMSNLDLSYSAGYCDWFKSSSSDESSYFWCPPSIKAAGIYIYTDAYFSKWDAPAGAIRGRVSKTIDCAFSPDDEDAGKVYSQGWNYAENYPIDGVVLEGQKTFQLKKTLFNRANIRRLFLYLEKQVVSLAKNYVYEKNTSIIRSKFVEDVSRVFDDAVQKNGIEEYYIKCDDENNTYKTIENNEFHCAIAVKPVKALEFLILDFTCTTGSSIVNEISQS